MRKKKVGSAAVHIPREHQSAPKEHWADKEVAKAAEEIRTGQFNPVDDDNTLGISLSRGTSIRDPRVIDIQGIQNTTDSLALAQHPRVQEALARLEEEKRTAKTPQEVLEKTQMLHEMNENAQDRNKWDGQGRWMGEGNEEARIGLILTPFQFLERLEKVIGQGRIYVNRFAVLKRVALLAPEVKSLLVIPGQLEKADNGMVRVGTLQYPCGSEWMVMRFDEYGVPTTPKYLGWRTALLSMIQLEVITEKEAHKAFPLKITPVSAWYREQLYMLRNAKGLAS